MSTNSDPESSEGQHDDDADTDTEATGTTEEPSTDGTTAADTSEANDDAPAAEADPGGAAAEETDGDADPSLESAATSPPAQFQAAITGGTLTTALKTVSTLVDETRIHIDGSGLVMRAVDPANVAMTDLTLEAAAFESYVATAGLLGVNLERLEEIARMATADDLVQFALDQESGKLVVQIDDLEFTMACLDPDTIRTDPDIPELDLPAAVVVESDDIDRAVTAADMVSERIRLGVDPEAAQFYAMAEGDTDDIRLDLDQDDLIDLVAGDVDSMFSLDYLEDINTAIPTSTEITLELGDSFPLILEYEFADGDAQVTQVLAPRIETE